MTPTDPTGLLVLDKPIGPTSHDLVARVRRLLGTRSVGHAGTLDPMASGVLLMLVGECTKLSAYLTLERKAYLAQVRFGEATDTLDATGEVTQRAEVPAEFLGAVEGLGQAPEDSLREAMRRERERTLQVPPAHAAIKQGGVKAYALARRGEVVVLPAREVRVFAAEIVGASVVGSTLDVSLDVSKGYYVRSFARDLGESVGIPAHLSALRRTRSGPYTIEQALPWEQAVNHWREALVPLEQVARTLLPEIPITEEGAIRAVQGKSLGDEDFVRPPPDVPSAWFTPSGRLVAVGDRSRDRPTVLRAFPSGLGVC